MWLCIYLLGDPLQLLEESRRCVMVAAFRLNWFYDDSRYVLTALVVSIKELFYFC